MVFMVQYGDFNNCYGFITIVNVTTCNDQECRGRSIILVIHAIQ